jgi:phosphoribosyl-AMP cyclohydrolase
MTNITKEFTYNVTDDQYSMTAVNTEIATATYVGAAFKNIVIDSETNCMTGGTVEDSQWDNGEFNNQLDGQYAVRVDCDADTLICALVADGGRFDVATWPEQSEVVPGCPIPYVRNNPMLPDHAIEVIEVRYDRANATFVKPYPWKRTIQDWPDLLKQRMSQITSGDVNVSEDLPAILITRMAKWKKWLRDLPANAGASWNIVTATAGTGYSVGDGILINDPVFKNNGSVPDILLTVTSVNAGTGAITGFTHSNAHCYDYQLNAATHNSVFYTTNSAGTGAVFNLSKVETVMPHKITLLRNPIENNDAYDTRDMSLYDALPE